MKINFKLIVIFIVAFFAININVFAEELNGWVAENGNIYYYIDGVMQRGVTEVDGNKYFFGEGTGRLFKTRVTALNGDLYIPDKDGKLYARWIEENESTYYTNENGVMQRGVIVVDGNKYFFGEGTGRLFKGFVTAFNGNVYYTNSNGIIQTGDQYIDGNWYKFNSEGVLQNGWQVIDGKTYFFYADGSRAIYVAKVAGERCEFSATGELEHRNIKVIIDVGKDQGIIDWDALWNSGEIDGVILRLGYSIGLDSTFARNLSEVKRLGIPYSVYHFSIAENEWEANNEFNHMLTWYRNYAINPTWGEIYYDIEGWKDKSINANSDGISVAMYDTIIHTYVDNAASNGITVKLYTGKNYAETRLSDYARSQIGWIAHYASYCGYTMTPYRGWQWTSKNHFTGINGDVDTSIFYY